MSDSLCEISLGDFDGEQASVYRAHVLVARKPHECEECGGVIAAGTRYERITGCWEGQWKTYRFCLPCSEIANEFSDSRTFGYLWEGMGEQWDEGAHVTACLNRLSTADAKRRLHLQWLRWKGLGA